MTSPAEKAIIAFFITSISLSIFRISEIYCSFSDRVISLLHMVSSVPSFSYLTSRVNDRSDGERYRNFKRNLAGMSAGPINNALLAQWRGEAFA